MDHCIKTPAQILQEYQNRHRGIAVNYNTIPTDQEGGRVFRTIVSVGNTVAEVGKQCQIISRCLNGFGSRVLHHRRSIPSN
jgi:hypothetical protein